MNYDISHPHDLRGVLDKSTVSTEEVDAFLADTAVDEDVKRKLLEDVRPQGYLLGAAAEDHLRTMLDPREAGLTQQKQATAQGITLVDQALATVTARPAPTSPARSLLGSRGDMPLTPEQALVWTLYVAVRYHGLPGARKGELERYERGCRSAGIADHEIAAAIAAGERDAFGDGA